MKRSQINAIIENAIEFLNEYKFKLPPFAYFTPEEWKEKNHEYDEIRNNMLGWDITDFGSGDFEKIGLFLFTLRNGNLKNPDDHKVYAEKIMIVQENQVTPYHYHWYKQEDIINRGGGNLLVKVYQAADSDREMSDTPCFSDEDVEIQVDGRHYTVPAGTVVRIEPGQSLTNTKYLYHSFWGEEGLGPVLVGEVSQCNDDNTDNRFFAPTGRFPAIDEDEPAKFLLGNEYPPAKD